MGQLAPYSEQQLKQALARSLGNMELATRLASTAVVEITKTHNYAATAVVESLTTAQQMIDSAGPLTQQQQGYVTYRTQSYLSEMLHLTDAAAGAIVTQLCRR